MPKDIALIRRRARIEELWLEGHSQKDIALTLGVTTSQVSSGLRAMSERLVAEQDETLEDKRAKATARKESLLRETINAFHLSQQPEEEISTQYKQEKCANCEGVGKTFDPEKEESSSCTVCDGKGTQLAEITTKKVKGKAGDSSLLSVARQLLADLDKISGIQAAKKVEVKGKIDHDHKTTISSGDWSRMNTEELMDLKSRIEEAKAKVPRIETQDAPIDTEFRTNDE